ncbi:hypothetical protein M0805_005496 [Coniferiporia weirii]|nr:hypothetical protein M0805_005496 [Coniferiporia weirii]
MENTRLPTATELAEAKARLNEQEKEAGELERKIEEAQRALEELIAASTRAISDLEHDLHNAEAGIRLTRELLSPMRRLPNDLLQHIFWAAFEDSPCCAWTLAAVCSSWRRIVLSMPRIWSKIRLVTTPNVNPDIIRLWLERSGSRVPLDIEIYLHVPAPPRKRRRAVTPIAVWSPPPGADMLFQAPPTPPAYIPAPPLPPVHTVQLGMHNVIPALPPPTGAAHTHAVYVDPTTGWRINRGKNSSATSSAWGHIAVFYLAEQMHRWKRFVFRFDRQFDSMVALKSICRDAPLLEEFEVSCGEPLRSDADIYPYDWGWLPSAERNPEIRLQNIRSVTLQYVPFRWSSPLIAANLRSISIRSLSTPGLGGHSSTQMTLDRLLHIIAANPLLENLSLHFQNAQPAVLPLEAVRLTELRSLSVGGSYTLTPLLDALITPALDALTLNIDREAPEESIAALLARSGAPPISFLSLAYQSQLGMGPYYGDAPGLVPWGFLTSLPHVRTLQIGHTALDVLMDALARVDEDAGEWLAPQLEHLALRNCHAHGDSVAKLIALVDARNPPHAGAAHPNGVTNVGIGGGTAGIAGPMPPLPIGGAGQPSRLKSLELYDCATLGDDIVRWLQSRIPDVKFSEPVLTRGIPRSPSYYPIDL